MEDFPHCVVQDCVPFGAAALLTFDTVTLTPMQGKGIAVPYCFGCLFIFFLSFCLYFFLFLGPPAGCLGPLKASQTRL